MASAPALTSRIITDPAAVNANWDRAKRWAGPIGERLWSLSVTDQAVMPPGPVIVVTNHVSVLDELLVGYALPRAGGFMSKAYVFDLPVVGRLIGPFGAFSVGNGDRRGVPAAVEVLKAGQPVILHPEGTRSPDGRWGTLPQRSGAARLALAYPVPIQPIALTGTFAVMPKGARWPRFGLPLAAHFGPPLLPDAYLPPDDWSEPARIGWIKMQIDQALRRLLPDTLQTAMPDDDD